MTERALLYKAGLRRKADTSAEGWDTLMRALAAAGKRCSTYRAPKAVRYETFCAVGIPVETWEPPIPSGKGIILYLHGGAYAQPLCDEHRALAQQLCTRTGRKVYAADYAVLPHVYPDALDEAITVWLWLAEQYDARDITVVGDSSGGNLALALALSLRELGSALPAMLALFSPWTDMTVSGDSYYDNYFLDPVLGCKDLGDKDIVSALQTCAMGAYFAGTDPTDPLVSPLWADWTGMPPCYVVCGGEEILYSDSVRLVKAMTQCGVDAHVEVGAELFHDFPLRFADFAEADRALDQACRWICRNDVAAVDLTQPDLDNPAPHVADEGETADK